VLLVLFVYTATVASIIVSLGSTRIGSLTRHNPRTINDRAILYA